MFGRLGLFLIRCGHLLLFNRVELRKERGEDLKCKGCLELKRELPLRLVRRKRKTCTLRRRDC